jgi:hypothetical protein
MGNISDVGLFSLMRDATSRAALEKYMLAHGVDPYTAREASIRCEKAALKNGALGAAVAGLLGLFATAPVAGLGAPAAMTLGLVVGSGGTLVLSQQCKEVQDAAFRIVNDLD